MITTLPTTALGANDPAILAIPDPKQVWVDGPRVVVTTGSDLQKPPTIDCVTPRQIRLALNASGLRPAIEAAIAAAPQDTKDSWEYATTIERNSPIVLGMAKALNKTGAEIDDLFALAANL